MTTRYFGFGINRYPAPDQLNGCINDIILSRNTFKALADIPNQYIHLRTDARATYSAYMEKFSDMCNLSAPGDTVIFWHSGHGSYVVDRNGDEVNDGYDECIVPYDYETQGMVLDDDVAYILTELGLKGVKVLMFFDSCFSGTMMKTAFGPLPNSSATMKTRTLLPSVDISSRFTPELKYPERGDTPERPPVVHGSFFAFKDLPPNVVVFSASQEDQPSYDLYIQEANGGKGAHHGLFSYGVCSALHRTQGKCTVLEFIGEVQKEMAMVRMTRQKPMLQCHPDTTSKMLVGLLS